VVLELVVGRVVVDELVVVEDSVVVVS